MTGHLLQPPAHHWECFSCDRLDTTHEQRPHSRMHACAGLGGMTVPFVPAGSRGEHRVNERQDYIGDELVQLNADGRPVMSIQTIREEGMDATVYAPTARAGA
jgi:hypothetical protein